MPAYNFQKQFVDMIYSGEKTQTIRRRRKRPTLAGETLKLYTGMRTKNCTLIFETQCLRVTPIEILPLAKAVVMNGNSLSEKELLDFVVKDGFDGVESFFNFFMRYSYETLQDELEVIYWRF